MVFEKGAKESCVLRGVVGRLVRLWFHSEV